MTTRLKLRSANRETTPEYNINAIAKNNGKITKTVLKNKSSERFSPINSKSNTSVKKCKGKETENPEDTQEPLQMDLEQETEVTSESSNTEQNLQQKTQDLYEIDSINDSTEETSDSFSQTNNNITNQTFSFEDNSQNTNSLNNTFRTPSLNTKPGKIFIEVGKIPGNNNQEKILFVKEKLAQLPSLKHVRIEYPIGDQEIVAIFSNLEDAQHACTLTITNNENTKFRLTPHTNFIDSNSRSIRVWDIPNHFTKKDLTSAFNSHGPLDYVSLQETGNVLSAILTFSKQSDYDRINQLWSVTHEHHSMRIFPYYNTRETKLQRNKFNATLTQLPPNVTPETLNNTISPTQVKSYYIPKDKNNQPK
jgi:hypothetical protein